MGLWEMVVAVVALGVVAKVITSYLESKKAGESSEGEIAEHLERIDRLEERVIVLEKIATDKRNNLKDEIDRL